MFHTKGFLFFLFIVLVLSIVLWSTGGSRVVDIAPYYYKKIIGKTATVTINDRTIAAEVAETPAARTKGLSGRHYLDRERGMLFLFERPAVYHFTLAETNLTLDIVWIEEYRIVYIAHQVQSGTAVVDPGVEADMVLEVGGQTARQAGWKVGDRVSVSR